MDVHVRVELIFNVKKKVSLKICRYETLFVSLPVDQKVRKIVTGRNSHNL